MFPVRFAQIAGVSLLAVACSTITPPKTPTNDDAVVKVAEPDVPVASPLQPILDQHWAMVLAESPTFATQFGVRDYDDQLGDPSLAAYEAGIEKRTEILNALRALSPDMLSDDDRLNRELLMLQLEDEIEASKFGGKYMIVTNRGGPHLNLTGLVSTLPFRTEADYRSYMARLEAMPAYLDAATERLRAGIDAGWVQPCAPMAGYEDSINIHVVADPEQSVFIDPFDKRPAGMDDETFMIMRFHAAEIIRKKVVPAFAKFEEFYNLEYQPNCRDEVGTSAMPGGAEYYEHRVRRFTTLDVTADDVHQIGLAEVARIRKEMEEIARGEGFKDLAAFQNYLRTDPQFYPKTPYDRVARASYILKKMDGQLVNLFTRLPRMPYDIKEIPLDIAEKTTTAYYQPPSGDGTRAGSYYINTTKLDTRPLYELEALSLHEAVPGHHLQIALQQELDLPNFRRFGGFTAFVEGWGLYSERLGLEVGFYETPYTDFGRLSYEMWRACRLVVDTGMHSKGWTRDQAIDFMAENSGLSMNNITTEVDRYITWPGQALAYKMGELKIRELRARAEKKLGRKFDLRRFHDTVLEAGAVPLSVLEERIDAWIAEEKRAG